QARGGEHGQLDGGLALRRRRGNLGRRRVRVLAARGERAEHERTEPHSDVLRLSHGLPTMTSVALMIATARTPTASPSRSTYAVVLTEPIRTAGAISITSLLITSPRLSSTTRPGKRLVALSAPRSSSGSR